MLTGLFSLGWLVCVYAFGYLVLSVNMFEDNSGASTWYLVSLWVTAIAGMLIMPSILKVVFLKSGMMTEIEAEDYPVYMYWPESWRE